MRLKKSTIMRVASPLKFTDLGIEREVFPRAFSYSVCRGGIIETCSRAVFFMLLSMLPDGGYEFEKYNRGATGMDLKIHCRLVITE